MKKAILTIRILIILLVFISCDFFDVLTISENKITIGLPDSSTEAYIGVDTINIIWTTEHIDKTPKVNIELLKNNEATLTIADSVENTNFYAWKIPSDLTEGSLYSIKIMDSRYPDTVYDIGEQFKIKAIPPVLTRFKVTQQPNEIDEDKWFDIRVTAYDQYGDVFNLNGILNLIIDNTTPYIYTNEQISAAISVEHENNSYTFINGTTGQKKIRFDYISNEYDNVEIFLTELILIWENGNIESINDDPIAVKNLVEIIEPENPVITDPVNYDASITIGFDKQIDISTFQPYSMALDIFPQVEDIILEWSDNNKTVTLTPKPAWDDLSSYTLMIKKDVITDTNGGKLTNPMNITFHTHKMPEIIYHYPEDKQENFFVDDINEYIEIHFDSMMKTNTFAENLELITTEIEPETNIFADSENVNLTWSNDDKNVTIRHTKPLKSYVDYRFTLKKEATELQGGKLGNDLVIDFKTEIVENPLYTDVFIDESKSVLFLDTLTMTPNGDVIAISYYEFDWITSEEIERVYVYRHNGNEWETPYIIESPSENIIEFGGSLDISDDGNRIVVGAPGYENALNQAGIAYRYDWNGTNWIRSIIGEGEPEDDTVEGRCSFGDAIAISDDGNTIIIGDRSADGYLGGAYVYRYDGTNWAEYKIQNPFYAEPESNYDSYGNAIAISGDGNTIAIANDDNNYRFTGIYKFDGTSWNQISISPLQNPLNPSSNYFGSSITMNDEGDFIIIGDSDSSLGEKVFIYEWDGTDWTYSTLISPLPYQDDGFGNCIAISDISLADGFENSTILVGDSGYDLYGAASGVVFRYFWDKESSSWGDPTEVYPKGQDHETGFGNKIFITDDGHDFIASNPGYLDLDTNEFFIGIYHFDF